ncbi:hypothetical protein HF086_002292 [Spodoptera exigua]|uniref:Uncharacterized protein n=1 Tax=Spodoptera exigua TaxID=7107 RepID=A0A922MW22_SPOEX|nr:hypothetical protein HF086_002292 [Spodoptera exigua]
MEHAQIQSSDGAQVMTLNGQQLQVLQMNNAPHMIQGPNGQQIVVHAVPSSAPAIQVATPSGQQIQQLQVVPISSIQAGGNIQPMQLVQTPDGQTFIYQPVAASAQPTIDQHQIIHQPTMINLNGNLVQVAGLGNAVQAQQIVNQPNPVGLLMVNNSNAGASTSVSEGACSSAAGSDEEPLLNMENMEQLSDDQKMLQDIKPDTVSITIIQDDEGQEQPAQWRRLAPQQTLQSA